jgi:hypothetical protein
MHLHMATGRFALGSGEALGVHQAGSVATKAEGSAFNHVCEEKTPTEVGECWRSLSIHSHCQYKSKKERITCFYTHIPLLLTKIHLYRKNYHSA